jgi:raffinose/stachyose/melibiose transport system permease protein
MTDLEKTTGFETKAVAISQDVGMLWHKTPFFRKKVLPWLFILPILLLYMMVVIGPSLFAIGYSLTDWSGIGDAEFIGLENFRKLFFDDPTFRDAFSNNVVWLAFFLIGLLSSSLTSCPASSQPLSGAIYSVPGVVSALN